MKDSASGCSTIIVVLVFLIWAATHWLDDYAFVGETLHWYNKGQMRDTLNTHYIASRRVESIIEVQNEKYGEKTVIYEFRQVPRWQQTVSAEKMRSSDILVQCFDGWRVYNSPSNVPPDFASLPEGRIEAYMDQRWTKCNGYAMPVYKNGELDSTLLR